MGSLPGERGASRFNAPPYSRVSLSIGALAILMAIGAFVRLSLVSLPAFAQYWYFEIGDAQCYGLLAQDSLLNFSSTRVEEVAAVLGLEILSCPQSASVSARRAFPALVALLQNFVGANAILIAPRLLAAAMVGVIVYASGRIAGRMPAFITGLLVSWSLIVTRWGSMGMADMLVAVALSAACLLLLTRCSALVLVVSLGGLIFVTTLTKQSWPYWWIFTIGLLLWMLISRSLRRYDDSIGRTAAASWLFIFTGPIALVAHLGWSRIASEQVGPVLLPKVAAAVAADSSGAVSDIANHGVRLLILLGNVGFQDFAFTMLCALVLVSSLRTKSAWNALAIVAFCVGCTVSFLNGSDVYGRFLLPAVPFIAIAAAMGVSQLLRREGERAAMPTGG